MRSLILLGCLFTMTQSFAGNIFQITPTYPAGTSDSIKNSLNTMFSQVEDEINSGLPDADASTYLDGVSNATVMAAKGQGADYSGNMRLFTAGFNLGLGMATTGSGGISDLQDGASTIAGFGAASSVNLGLSLSPFGLPKIGFIDLAKFKIFVNYLSLSLPSSIDNVTGNMSTFGIHLQYKIMEGKGVPKLLQWNGVDFTTGFNATSFDFSITDTFEASQDATVGGQPATVSFENEVTLGAEVSTYSIPIEISTSAQALYFFSPFLGLGVDFNFGSASSSIEGEGPVTITGTGIPAGVTAESVLNLGDTGGPSFTNARLFYGTQINLSVLKFIFQINQGLGNDALAANIGAKITW